MKILAPLVILLALAMYGASPSAHGDVVDINHNQYKRVHQIAVRAIIDGKVEAAIKALEDRVKEYPEDPDNLFALAIGEAHRDNPEEAVAYLRQALELGLPLGRIWAEATNHLAPIAETDPFKSLLEENPAGIIHGPMIGQLTTSNAFAWFRLAVPAVVRIEIFHQAEDTEPLFESAAVPSNEMDRTLLLPIANLEAGKQYYYRASTPLLDGGEVLRGSFRTPPSSMEGGQFTIAFGGGAGYTPQHEYMWNTIAQTQPIALMMMGDNIYPDDPESIEMQRFNYYRRQSQPLWRQLVQNTAVYAIWDDHDFGVNDCWGGPEIDEPAWKRPVWEVFRQNWVNPAYGGGERQPGCWFSTSIGNVDFFFLDGRYYRTDPKEENPSMLGPVQKEWLLYSLSVSNAVFKVIASPVPVVTGTKGGSGASDTWDGFPEEREEILSHIETEKIEGVFIISADRHRSDVWRIDRPNGYDIYEFESSRLTNIHKHDEHPNALFSYNKKPSFGTLAFDTAAEDPIVTYTIHSIDGEEIHQHELRRSQLKF